jgi:hypothetical protein
VLHSFYRPFVLHHCILPAHYARSTPLTLLALGSISHTQQLESLDARAPFLLLTLTHSREQSKATWRAVFE